MNPGTGTRANEPPHDRPHPHHEPPPGAIGQHDGKFTCDRSVLRFRLARDA